MSETATRKPVFLGQEPSQVLLLLPVGQEVTLNGETYYKDQRRRPDAPVLHEHREPLDHWMFLASNGGLSAGRVNSDHALFPYYTDDKITEAAETTGSSKTLILVEAEDRRVLVGSPFQGNQVYRIERHLYKNAYGNKVIREETNHDLDLTFRYQWAASERYGFVRQARLESAAAVPVRVSVLDGIQNVLPYGVPEGLQRGSSNLVDAYKKCELEGGTLGLYALSAIISDKAEPSESLKSNVVWSVDWTPPRCSSPPASCTPSRRARPSRRKPTSRPSAGLTSCKATSNWPPKADRAR